MYDIIFNPAAGKKRALKALNVTENFLRQRGVEYRVHTSPGYKRVSELANGLSVSGAENIVVMGGDGTLSETLNGIADLTKCKLGLIPCGTGNDFAASAKIPSDTVKAWELILKNAPKHTDYMRIGDLRGINVIGTGIDVDVLKRYYKHKKRSKFTYMKSLIASLFRFKFYYIGARFNGREKQSSCMIVAVGNGKMIGGGINMCPAAEIDDGLLDVVIVENMKKRSIPSAFVMLLRKKILKCKHTFFERTEKISVTTEHPATVNVDGELYDGLPFEVEIVKYELMMFR